MKAYRKYTNMAIEANVRLNFLFKVLGQKLLALQPFWEFWRKPKIPGQATEQSESRLFSRGYCNRSYGHRSDSYASLDGANADEESQPIPQTRKIY